MSWRRRIELFQSSFTNFNRTSDYWEIPHGWKLVASCGVGDLEDYVSMSSLDDFPKIFIIIPDSIVSLSLSLDCYFNVIV